MKRFVLALLLLALLITGCAAEEMPTEITTESTAPAPTSVAAQGLYDPDSTLEAETHGGVKVYPLGMTNVRGIRALEDSVLVFSGGENDTTITQLSGGNLAPEVSFTAQDYLDLPDISFHGSTLSYFSRSLGNQTVVLSSPLQQLRTIPAPEGLVGTPLLSRDESTLYYCTAGAVRALDLESGISRLLKQIPAQELTVTGIYLQDTVLKLQLTDEYGLWRCMYLSTEDGRILWEDSGELLIYDGEDRYFANYYEGTYPSHLFGTPGGETRELFPLHPEAMCFYLPGRNAVVTTAYTGEAQVLDYYDLSTGKRTATLSFPVDHYIHDITEGPDSRVCFLRYEESYGCDVLYAWEPAMTPSDDETAYTADHHSAENPDYAGLEECRVYAQALSEKHGVQIRIYREAAALEPTDYDLTPEHNVTVLHRELELLDKHLSSYPAGFLSQLSSHFDGIRICIVRSLTGSAESGSLEEAAGVQFWDGYTACIALAAHMNTEYSLYHELCHLIDSVVLTQSTAYDRWDTLNPQDFSYDNSYITNLDRDGSPWLKPGSESFIDTYAMSYAKEDRARIMEYAMTEGNETYFQSRTMQKKLLTLCQGIRDAFDLKKSPETFLWEQYLTTSLAYTE